MDKQKQEGVMMKIVTTKVRGLRCEEDLKDKINALLESRVIRSYSTHNDGQYVTMFGDGWGNNSAKKVSEALGFEVTVDNSDDRYWEGTVTGIHNAYVVRRVPAAATETN